MAARVLTCVLFVSIAWGQALEQGKRAFDNGNYAEAARLFEKAHQSSKDCEILFFIGMARHRLGESDAALIAFQSAIQCNPKLFPAHDALAEAYYERGNPGEALAAYQRALALDPNHVPALRGAASIHLELEHAAAAIPFLERLVAVDPKDAGARSELAAAYFGTGNSEGAEAQYVEALRLKPAHPSALLGLGYIYIRRGEETNAIPLLRKAAAAAPKEYRPHFLLGTVYNHLEKYREAVAEFEAALRLGSSDAEVYYQLARAYGKLDRMDDRRQALARFSELTRQSSRQREDQRQAVRLTEEAQVLVEAGDLRGAVVRLEEARVIRPSDDKILFRLAGLNFDLKQFENARNYSQEAISLAPSEWLYHYLLGLVEVSSGRRRDARGSFETARKLNASAAEVHDALGELYLEENDLTQALACFRRAVELRPDEPLYRQHLTSASRRVK